MTATGVPPSASDSGHMSFRSSSTRRFRERSWTAGAGRVWARQEVVLRRARGPVGVWSRSVILIFAFLALFLSSAHSQATLDQDANNRTALNRQIFTAAFSFLNSITASNASIKTGAIYNVSLPGNINDNSVELESIQVVRLRSGSLKRHGIILSEINLPKGVQVVQSFLYVVLVYRRFNQYSYYDTTNGTVFVAPVVGVLAYSYADNFNNYTNNYGQELSIVASAGAPIGVQLQASRDISQNELDCISYTNTVNGTATGVVKNLTSPAVCSWNTIGDFSLLGPPYHHKSSTWKIVVGSVVGGLAALVLLALVIILALWFRERRNFASMEQKSDQGEPLHHTWFGNSRAPSAASTRTKPVLENENV